MANYSLTLHLTDQRGWIDRELGWHRAEDDPSAEAYRTNDVAEYRRHLDLSRGELKDANRALQHHARHFRNNRAMGGQKQLNDAARQFRHAEAVVDDAELLWALSLEVWSILANDEADAAAAGA